MSARYSDVTVKQDCRSLVNLVKSHEAEIIKLRAELHEAKVKAAAYKNIIAAYQRKEGG